MEYIKMQYVMINAEVHHAMTLMGTVLSSNRVDKPTPEQFDEALDNIM